MTLYIPGSQFKAGARTTRRRLEHLAAADFAEGARRDLYEWERFREPYSARRTLKEEYIGARINAGLRVAERRSALVIVRAAGNRLERLFLPTEKWMPPDTAPAAYLFRFAEDYSLWNDWTVVEDHLPLRGAR